MKDSMIVVGDSDKGLKWDWTNPFSFSKEKKISRLCTTSTKAL